MDILVDFSKSVDALITLPASKSISNRALIIRAIAGESSPIENLSICDDTDVLQQALISVEQTIDIGAAGTAMRFLTAFFSQSISCECVLTGTERMKQRPIRLLVEALETLGANISYVEKEGFPPLKIVGEKLLGGKICLKGDVSSQYISALMMIAPAMKNGLKLELIPPVISRPYIDLTIHLMKEFGVVVHSNGNCIEIPHQHYKMKPFVVESDWSAASYWYEILALKKEGEFFLKGLTQNSFQGDSKLVDLFSQLGVSTFFEETGVRIVADGKPIAELKYNFVNQPDLAQTFVVTCCFLGVPFHFAGLESLKIKETDRIFALKTELLKFGFELIEPKNGELMWKGNMQRAVVEQVSVATYNDHRMAMSFAPIALKMPIRIENKDVVSKSYPTFWSDLCKAGFVLFEQ